MQRLILLFLILLLPLQSPPPCFAEKTYDLTYPLTRGSTYRIDTTLDVFKRGTDQAISYLFDNYPALIGFSGDQLDSSATNCLRVRRSIDSTEQDIGFVSGQLDTASLLSFVGGENHLSYSEQIDATKDWGFNATTATQNQTTAPDSTLTADKVTPTAGSAIHNFYSSSSIVSGTTYVDSYYVKSNGYQWIQVFGGGTTDNPLNNWVNFDIINGVVGNKGSAATGNYGIEDVGNGWFRIWLKATCITTTTNLITALCALGNTDIASRNPSFTADGTSGYYVWGGQRGTNTLKDYVKTEGTGNTANGYVTKWYNQGTGGATYDLTQTTVANMPIIVDAGALVVDGGKLAMKFNASIGNWLEYSSSVVINQPFTGFSVARDTGLIDANNLLYDSNLGSTRNFIARTPANDFILSAENTGTAFISQPANNNQNIFYFLANATNSTLALNGAVGTNGNIGTNSLNGLTLGSIRPVVPRQPYSFDGTIQELIIYNSDQSANREAIEADINSRFNIY